ncbi:MAG: SCO family protein [Cyclobacteriaceae bacterium]
MKIIPWIGLLAMTLTACSKTDKKEAATNSLPYYKEATFTPHWYIGSEELPKDFHKVSDFTLTNQSGDIISEETISDKITVVDFFFTSCPGICPKMTSNMKIIQDRFLNDSDVILLSHSVTPEYDSVPILAAYAEEKGVIADKWHLLTGSREQIYHLGRKQYFVEEDLGLTKSEDEFIHTENFVLLDQNRHIRGIYNGLNKSSVELLIKDIRVLQDRS